MRRADAYMQSKPYLTNDGFDWRPFVIRVPEQISALHNGLDRFYLHEGSTLTLPLKQQFSSSNSPIIHLKHFTIQHNSDQFLFYTLLNFIYYILVTTLNYSLLSKFLSFL